MPVLLALIFVLAAGDGQAQLKPAKLPRDIAAKQLTVTTSQSVTAARTGAEVSLFVDVFPKPKMHVYAPEQKGGYIRITLDLDKSAAIKAGAPIFPKGADYYFEPLGETFKVFDAAFRIRQDVRILSSARPVIVTGTLRYQACDDQVCYRPDEVKVSWTLSRQPPGGRTPAVAR